MRDAYKIEDMLWVLRALIASKQSAAPWSRWEIILGWPETNVFEELTKPFIYLLEPQKIRDIKQIGGGKSLAVWEMILGAWDDRKTGGTGEINIIASHLLDLFGDDSTHALTFTVSIGGTAYTSKTLTDHGIQIVSITGPFPRAVTDLKEFRYEFNLTLRA